MDRTTRPAEPGISTTRAGGIEMSFLGLINVVLRHRRTFVLIPSVFAALLVGWTLLQEREYSADAAFITEQTQSGNSGILSLARSIGVAGVDGGTGSSPEFFAQLLTGREILRSAVETEYTFTVGREAVVKAPLVEIFASKEGAVDSHGLREASEELRRRISVTVDQNTGLVTLRVVAGQPALAEAVAARLLELLGMFNVETRQSRAREKAEWVSGRLDATRRELERAEETMQEFLEQNRQFANSSQLAFEYERLQRNVAMRQQLYTVLAEAYEEARMEAIRDTPVLTIVASPVDSAQPVSRGTVFYAVLGVLIGLLLAGLVVLFRESTRTARVMAKSEYDEFRTLSQEALTDIRALIPWVGRRREER